MLTDNEKTATVEHIAGTAGRNPQMVAFARHCDVSVLTCEPADPASKGGSEATVKIAEADLVPTEANLRDQYATFGELEAACAEFCGQVNARVHRITRQAHDVMAAQEASRLHTLPADPHAVAFGVTRRIPVNTPMVGFEAGQYSVPHHLLDQSVWVRAHDTGTDQQVVIVHVRDAGPVEVARHRWARNDAEAEFLTLVEGAQSWLSEAAAAGTGKIRMKMVQAVALAKLFGPSEVDAALCYGMSPARHHGRV